MANDWDTVDDWFTDDMTTDVVYSGYTLAGILYMSQTDNLAIAAGLQPQHTQRLMLRVADCDEISWTPDADDTVTVEGTDRIVVMAVKDSTRKCYTLDIQETTPRA